jgi:hypothetical protein
MLEVVLFSLSRHLLLLVQCLVLVLIEQGSCVQLDSIRYLGPFLGVLSRVAWFCSLILHLLTILVVSFLGTIFKA